jgi:hypothetical protein
VKVVVGALEKAASSSKNPDEPVLGVPKFCVVDEESLVVK